MIGCWEDGQEDDDERDIQRFFRLSRLHMSRTIEEPAAVT